MQSSNLYLTLLKLWIFLLFVFNAGVVGFLWHLDSLDKQEEKKIEQEQNAYRSRIILSHNLDRLHHSATAWCQGLAVPSKTSMSLLCKWQIDETNYLAENLDHTAPITKYMNNILQTAQIFVDHSKKFGEELPVNALTVEGKKRSVQDYWKLFGEYNYARVSFWAPPYKEAEEYLMRTAAKNNAANVKLVQDTLLIVFTVNILSLLALALLPLILSRVMVSFRDNTSLFQKFCIIVAVPLFCQLSIYAILAGFTYQVTKQLKQIALFYEVEELCRTTHREISHLLVNGETDKRQSVSQTIAHLQMQKRINQPNNKMLGRWYDEIITQLPEILALRPALSAENLWIGGGKLSMYSDEKFRESCERFMTLQRIAYPSIGKEGWVRHSREALDEQLGKIQLIMNLALMACASQIGMAFLTLRLFRNSIAQRFSLVTENIERYSRHEALSKALEGKDEAALLESFLRKTAYTIEDLSQKEKQMIDNASDVIFSVSEQLNIKSINEAASKVWGYDRNELIDKPFVQLIRERDLVANPSWMQTLKDAPGSQEFRIKHKYDADLDCIITAQWAPESNQFFCVVQDITAQKQIDRLKQDLLAMVSHDLRTPLTSSTMFLELLGMGVFGDLSEAGASELQELLLRSAELMSLIKDLLDIERLQSEDSTADCYELELSDLRPGILSVISDAVKRKSINVSLSCSDEIFVNVNEDRLLQALINVLLVIIHKAKVNSDLNMTMSKRHNFAEIAMDWCNEINMSALKEDAFEIYKARSSEETARGTSSKLGLPLVRSIIKHHKGEILLQEMPPNRTTCIFQIPLSRSGNNANGDLSA